jgi:hypothetical protein
MATRPKELRETLLILLLQSSKLNDRIIHTMISGAISTDTLAQLARYLENMKSYLSLLEGRKAPAIEEL